MTVQERHPSQYDDCNARHPFDLQVNEYLPVSRVEYVERE